MVLFSLLGADSLRHRYNNMAHVEWDPISLSEAPKWKSWSQAWLLLINPIFYMLMTFPNWKCDGFTEGCSWKNWSRDGSFDCVECNSVFLVVSSFPLPKMWWKGALAVFNNLQIHLFEGIFWKIPVCNLIKAFSLSWLKVFSRTATGKGRTLVAWH